ncbi:MAG: AMP-binding protein [Gammaproteobacteria bacterium]|nr:AMP-binding protein [Gammaproteobacteria bacterium]
MAELTQRFGTLVDIYTQAFRNFGDRPVFGTKTGDEWHWITYREFGELVDQMRGGLASLGVGRGDRVAIISNNRVEWAVIAGATYTLGGTIVPMYETQLDKDWKYIIKDCEAKVLFVPNEEIAGRIKAFGNVFPTLEHIVVIDAGPDYEGLTYKELLERGSAQPAPVAEVDRDDLADIIYTSGTTGNPKGVLLTHANLADNVSAELSVVPVTGDDRTLSFLPWAHSFGQTLELHGILATGGSMGIAESAAKIAENLMEVKPTLLIAVPRIFNRVYDGVKALMAEEGGLKKKLFDAALDNEYRRMDMAEAGRTSPWVEVKHALFDRLVFSKIRERFGGRLKYAASGSAALSPEVNKFVDALGIVVLQGYGLSETSPLATVNPPEKRKFGSVGPAVPGIRIALDHVATADPNDGEIIIYGHCVMRGYHNLPEENAAVFTEDGGLRTGDIGHLDEDGYLFITGRVKEQYKLENGKYVVPAPIEEQVRLSPFIANIMIYGMNHPHNVALIVPDFDALARWAEEQGIDASDRRRLITDERVRDLFALEIEAHSEGIKSYERVRGFFLVEEDFTQENGILSQTLKVKRREVMRRYGGDLESLYK